MDSIESIPNTDPGAHPDPRVESELRRLRAQVARLVSMGLDRGDLVFEVDVVLDSLAGTLGEPMQLSHRDGMMISQGGNDGNH